MADLLYYVDTDHATGDTTDGSETYPYHTLNDAEQALDQNLDTANNTLTIRCKGATADTTAVSVSGWTTSATDWLRIEAVAADSTGRHAGVWNTGKYRLSVTDATAFTMGEDYVRVEGLQIETLIGGSPANGRHVLSYAGIGASNDLRVGNCLLKGHADGTYTQDAVSGGDADAVFTMWNCIIYNIAKLAGSRCVVPQGTTAFLGCTFIGGQYGTRCLTGTHAFKNCYAGDALTECFNRSTGTLNKTTCASSDESANDTSSTDETATGTCPINIAYSTDNFLSVTPATDGTGDYLKVKSGGGLHEAGTTLNDDPPGGTALGVDIAGNTRS